MTALDHIATRGAERSPDRPAIVTPAGDVVTYAELDRRATAFAASLLAGGASPGDRLILANFNTPEFFAALFGAARAGLVAIPLDPGLAATELVNILVHARPHAVVADDRSTPTFAALGAPLYTPREANGRTAAPGRGGSAPALIIYTSGTTGRPRGAVHSHAGIQHKLDAIKSWFELGESDSSLCMLPTHFGHGLVCVCLSALNYGGTLVLCRPFDMELLPRVFALADQYRVTTFSTVPTIARLMIRNRETAPPAGGHLRFVTCASAPLHPEEAAAFEDRFGVPLLNCYGLTEGGTWCAVSPNDPDRDRHSVGVAVGSSFRVVSRTGTPLPPGEVGELQVSGPSVMLGYHDDEPATARVLRGGWLSTGDLGRMDEQGRVFLAGRSKDLIIRAGANVYPAEIEGVLLRHPDVAEAYVVGLPHEILGEKVGACVVRKEGAVISGAELIAHCRNALSPYKCPETIRFVDSVPKTSRGKVNRASLEALMAPAR